MTTDHPQEPLSKPAEFLLDFLKLCWPLPGAMIGITTSFFVYFQRDGLNTDTAAPLFIGAFWAFGGLMFGILFGSILACMIELGLQRILPKKPLITASLTLGLLIGIYVLTLDPIKNQLPKLFWTKIEQYSQSKSLQLIPVPPVSSDPISSCSKEPPKDSDIWKSWDLECGK